MKKRDIFGNSRSKKRGQVWIETVTYTLIAFVMIGLVLSFAKPKIEEFQDKIIAEQSVKMLKEIDSIISEVSEGGQGNKRKIELGLKKGNLEIVPVNDTLIFSMQSRYVYSEPNETYQEGPLDIFTEPRGKYNEITMSMNYSGTYNITYELKENAKIISKASTPYNVFIANNGGDLKIINFEIN